MYPHERSLVEAFADRPFALVGVNGDIPDKLAEIENSRNLTWRSFAAGRNGGKAASDYGIRAWPTVILIDERGVIRARDVRTSQLDEGIIALIREAEERSKKAGS